MSSTTLEHSEINFSDPEIKRDVFILDGDPSQAPVLYPAGWYDRYREVFDRMEAARAARDAVLAEAKQRLVDAKIALNELKANSPEVAEAKAAEADLQDFRKFVWSHGFSFPHPDKLIPIKE